MSNFQSYFKTFLPNLYQEAHQIGEYPQPNFTQQSLEKSDNSKIKIDIYEMQLISNALIAYARLLAQKKEEKRSEQVRELEKKFYSYLLSSEI
jgi:hypothetical protein